METILRSIPLLCSLVVCIGWAHAEDASLADWSRGEAVVLMRHALAPGTGDPTTVVLGDCTTQRNLSDAGREQARTIGLQLQDALRDVDSDRGVEVVSSGWCRCLETGRLLSLGDVERLPALDSFFTARERAPAATAELVEWLDTYFANDGPPAVLVSHQVNISALTGEFTRSGEMLLVAPDASAPTGYGVIGSIETAVPR